MHKKFFWPLVFIIGLPLVLVNPAPSAGMTPEEDPNWPVGMKTPKQLQEENRIRDEDYKITNGNEAKQILLQITRDPLIDPRELAKLSGPKKKKK